MKKIFSCMLFLLIAFSCVLPVNADFQNPPVVDRAGYLMEPELEVLSEELEEIREKYNFEVAIYTENYMSGYDAESSADDIYDYNGYGAGADCDGIMLYICSDTREYHFTTCGKGIGYFNQNGLKYLEGKVLPYLSEDNYYGAFSAYIDTADELIEMAEQGSPYNEKQYSNAYLMGVIIAALLIPLLIAFIMMSIKLGKMRTAVGNDYAANYMKSGSMNLRVSRDIFLYSRVTKTAKPKSNSGTHTSSSGRSHGGRGGSF